MSAVKDSIKQNIDCRRLFEQEFPDYFQKSGNSFNPWGDGSSPSMGLYDDHVYGFNDQTSRDCFAMIMLSRKVTFKESVPICAEIAGLGLEESEDGNGNRAKRRRPTKQEDERKSFPSIDTAIDHFRPIAVYRYLHANGSLNYCELKIRTEKRKACFPLHEEPDGLWYLDLQGVTRTLFGLPELLESDPDSWVVFTEGAKDAQTAQQIGFVAVTTGSSGSLKRAHEDGALEPLRGRRVALFADRDDAGAKMEKAGSEILPEIAKELRIVTLPNPEGIKGYDLSDYVSDVGEDDAAQLMRELIENTPLEAYKPAQREPKKQSGPLIVSCKELMETEIPEPRWVVHGLLAEGLAILVAKPKVGKSWLCQSLALAVAQGIDALGSFPTAWAGALNLCLEDNHRRMKSRLLTLLEGRPAPENHLITCEWPEFKDDLALSFLEKTVEENPGIKLVTVDTWQRFRGKKGRNEDIYSADYADLGKLHSFARRYELCVLLVHHSPKEAKEDPLDGALGSTAISGSVDVFLSLTKKNRMDEYATLFVTGRDIPDAEHALTFNNGIWVYAGSPAEVRMTDERKEVRRTIQAVGHAIGPSEISKLSGKSYEATKKLLSRMSDKGELVRLDGGKYGIPDEDTLYGPISGAAWEFKEAST